MPPGLHARLSGEWRAFLAPRLERPFLHVEVRLGEVFRPGVRPRHAQMEARIERGRARFATEAGSIHLRRGEPAQLLLDQRPGRRQRLTLENLLRAALAWRLPDRGAALLHAAGLVVDGRAFLLVGPHDSGKTTWTRIGAGAGATALSDDLVLLDRIGSRTEALGAPFFSTHVAAYRPGRWPLAGVLFPAHGDGPALRAVPPLLARARITANLPFIAQALELDDRIAALVDRIVDVHRPAEITFAVDSRFLDLLRAWPAEQV